MYIGKSSNYFTKNKYGDEKSNQSDVDRDLQTIFTALQGRLRFGSGTTGFKGENIGGVWLDIFTSGTALFQIGYKHLLESQPMGYIVCGQDKSGELIGNPLGDMVNTVWTNGTAYFRSSGTSVNFKVFLLERGGQ